MGRGLDMAQREGIFSGDDPFALVRAWMDEAEKKEVNDPNAMALATCDADGMPNVRTVLLKEILPDGFVFYTNYGSAKGQEIAASGLAAFVLHWKSLRRQIRVRGEVTREDNERADEYYASRAINSRLGAWASRQSAPLRDRAQLEQGLEEARLRHGDTPPRPPFWGGFRITPLEIEFWADGPHRLHDRFRWKRDVAQGPWHIERLYP